MLRLKPALRSLAPALALAVAPLWALPGLAIGSADRGAEPVLGGGPLIESPRATQWRASRGAPRGALPVFVAPDGERVTAERIRDYLERKDSPLRRYAAEIVRAGVRWKVDPRVVVAIAGLESDFGRVRARYNAWGWGIDQVRYSSWPNAIARFTKAFSLTFPSMRYGDFHAGAPRYAPADPAEWVRKAAAYFKAI